MRHILTIFLRVLMRVGIEEISQKQMASPFTMKVGISFGEQGMSIVRRLSYHFSEQSVQQKKYQVILKEVIMWLKISALVFS